MTTLGATLTRVSPGLVEVDMPFSPAFTQQHRFLHAGIVSTALDAACGSAALLLMPANTGVLTIEFKVNLLAPASGERFLFRASVKKPGRTILVVDGQAFAETSAAEPKLIATMIVITQRAGIEN